MAKLGLTRLSASLLSRVGRAWNSQVLTILFVLLSASTSGIAVSLIGSDWVSLWQSLILGLFLGWILAVLGTPAWRALCILLITGLIYTFLYHGGLAEKISSAASAWFRFGTNI